VRSAARRRDRDLAERHQGLRELLDRRTTELREQAAKRRRAEQRLRRAEAERQRALDEARQAHEAARRAHGETLARMSHEIRTPMNGVIGMIDLLQATPLDARQQRCLQIAKTSADALLEVINDVLDFSRIEAGRLTLDEADFDPRMVVEDAVHVLSHRAAEKGLELACRVHPGFPSAVRGDGERLRQILVNLVRNAIKFTERGEVTVEAAVESEGPERHVLQFVVRDTGVGIAPERADMLFRPVCPPDGPDAPAQGGTGLGLAVAKRLAEMMGGQIGFESEPAKGSTFWFTASVARAAQPQAAPPVVRPAAGSLRVLAVDDNETNREILRAQLTDWGFDVETAPDGQRALRQLHDAVERDRPFSLAVLDMSMPGMNGLDLARAIKTSSRLKDTVLLMLSSTSDQPTASRARELGLAGLLVKPARQAELLDAIASALPGAPVAAQPGRATRGAVLAPPAPPALARTDARILLAEDNEIDQEVARQILIAAGATVDVADDGRGAVQAVLARRYDLVVMDCRMPEMDGLEAARRIREYERQGRQLAARPGPLPVVALTSEAGMAPRCLEAGMNAHLSKPAKAETLVRTINSLLPAQAPPDVAPPAEAPAPAPAGTPPIDYDELLERCLGRAGFVAGILGKFEQKAQADVAALAESVRAGDAERIAFLAHAMKGAAANLSAKALRQAAFELETLARSGDLSQAEPALLRLQTELRRCLDDLPALAARAAGTPQHACSGDDS